MKRNSTAALALIAVMSLPGLSGCAGDVADQADPAAGADLAALTTTGSILSVYANDAFTQVNRQVQLTTVVTASGTVDQTVTWAMDPTALGTVTAAGLYSAPSAPGKFKAWATSKADPTKKDYCWITVSSTASGAVTSVYANDASVTAGQSVQLSAKVTSSGAVDPSVSWALDAGTQGTVTRAGLYAAPQTPGTYKAWATSNADPTKKDYCWIKVVSSTTPGSITSVYAHDAAVPAGNSVQLAADVTASGTIDKSVTWSLDPTALGTITRQGLYTAPATAGMFKAWATSVADPTRKDYCWVSVSGTTPTPPPAPPPAPPPGPPPAPPPSIDGRTLSFPGCEGAGCDSVGGRGGTVIKVTNLNDSGPGSLRACINASGPRTCVFTVGGKIQVTSELKVLNPYLTIAGQTAPGGGIEVVGLHQSGYVFSTRTHDVIVRYVRFFNNANPPCAESSQGCGVINNYTPAANVVLDHLTAAYTQDENLTLWSTSASGPRNFTVSWILNAYPLADHPTGSCIAGGTPANNSSMTDIDFHHNYYADVGHRIFVGGARSVRWAYNIALNYSWYGLRTGGGVTDDIVGNIYRCGPSTNCNSFFPYTVANEPSWPAGSPSLFFHNNVWKTSSNGVKVAGNLSDASMWPLSVCMAANSSASASCTGTASTSFRRPAAIPAPALGTPIANGYSFELAADGSNLETAMFDAGAAGDALRGTPYGPVGPSRRLDCNGNLVNNMDGLLQRAITEYVGGGSSTYAPAGGTRAPTTQNDICWAPGQCGIPTLAAGTACPDADGDGMPDAWEAHWGLNAGSASGEDGPNGHKLSSSYTNLEMYLSGYKGF